uniref:DUF4340 domain-containing protein n=1 Tax=candidate division WOR-3 bacterium TaxID=2052148 RepID=A0A7C4XL43_UNCW3
MKYRTIIILAGIIIILLLIVLFTGKKREPRYVISVEELKSIRIERPADTTEIEISPGGYRLIRPLEYSADSGLIANLLNGLKELQLGEVISQREDKYRDFEVDEKGIKLTLKGKKDIAFYIGKYAGDYLHSYLRFVQDKKVYLARGINKYQVNRSPDDWRDKTVLKLDRNSIAKIAFDEKEIVKRDTLWFYKDQQIERQKIDNILNLFSNLKANGFCDTAVFQKKYTIRIFAGSEYILEVGEKKDYSYLVKLPDKQTIFLVNEYVINSLNEVLPVIQAPAEVKKG